MDVDNLSSPFLMSIGLAREAVEDFSFRNCWVLIAEPFKVASFTISTVTVRTIPTNPACRQIVGWMRRSVTTDALGTSFQANPGAYNIAVVSADLDAKWRATSATEQRGFLSVRQTVNVSFGLNNYGSVAGRVFNDISQKGEHAAGTLPGVADVRLTLRPANATDPSPSVTADGSGSYQFRNIPPGNYTLELAPETLPADFAMLRQTSWSVVVHPLQNFYLDIPISAQRAVSGFVFVDQDGNGKFDPEKDQPIAGARVRTGKIEVVTGSGGAYILRNIPYGTIEVGARSPWGTESTVIQVELGTGPTRRYGINLCVRK